MTTAVQMITRAMRLAGVIGKGEAPDADESADGLMALNAMLDSWSIERLFVYYIVQEALTLSPGNATYTMGVGGDLNTTRPTRVEDSCFIRYNSIDTPCALIDQAAYAGLGSKTVQSNIPQWLYVDYQNPLVRLNFYPTPSSASAAAYIQSWKQLQQFSALTDVLALPPGHQRAIEYSLAEEFGPEFGVEIPMKVQQIAAKARANLKRINAPSPVMASEAGYMNWPSGRNIYAG